MYIHDPAVLTIVLFLGIEAGSLNSVASQVLRTSSLHVMESHVLTDCTIERICRLDGSLTACAFAFYKNETEGGWVFRKALRYPHQQAQPFSDEAQCKNSSSSAAAAEDNPLWIPHYWWHRGLVLDKRQHGEGE